MQKKNRLRKKIKEEKSMATQIAPTPVIRGIQARRILQESLKQPTAKSEMGARKLIAFFEKKK